MTIKIDENTIGVWFCDLGPTEDYMMAMYRHRGGIRFRYRVRHHNPDSTDPFDGKDQKSWNEFGTNDPDEAKAILAAREMIKGLINLSVGLGKITLPHKIFELLRGDQSFEQFAELVMKAPFAHVQKHNLQ